MANGNGRSWVTKDRLGWWVKVLTLSTLIASAYHAGSSWAYSRVSKEELVEVKEQLVSSIQDCAKKEEVDKALIEVGKRMNKSEMVLWNIRINMERLMAQYDVKAKPLPSSVIKDFKSLIGDEE